MALLLESRQVAGFSRPLNCLQGGKRRRSFSSRPFVVPGPTPRPMRFFASLILLAAVLSASAVETETLYLSGRGSDDAVAWDFYCTKGRNSGVWTKIPVPSCWELQGFGAYEYGVMIRPSESQPNRPPLADEQGRYRHEFTVPAAWRGRVVRLVFEGVMTDTEVKVNGRSAGPVHQGGFYRFHHDITHLLRFDGPNLLEVTVSKRSANDSVNRAERYADYWNFGGIFRPVRLEALPAQFIDRVAIDAKADGSFTADVFLGGTQPDGGLTLQLKTLDGRPFGAPVQQGFRAGATQLKITAAAREPATWSAETPALYLAEFTLETSASVPTAHTFTQRFGFRCGRARGCSSTAAASSSRASTATASGPTPAARCRRSACARTCSC
jgi:hypothetical protein